MFTTATSNYKFIYGRNEQLKIKYSLPCIEEDTDFKAYLDSIPLFATARGPGPRGITTQPRGGHSVQFDGKATSAVVRRSSRIWEYQGTVLLGGLGGDVEQICGVANGRLSHLSCSRAAWAWKRRSSDCRVRPGGGGRRRRMLRTVSRGLLTRPYRGHGNAREARKCGRADERSVRDSASALMLCPPSPAVFRFRREHGRGGLRGGAHSEDKSLTSGEEGTKIQMRLVSSRVEPEVFRRIKPLDQSSTYLDTASLASISSSGSRHRSENPKFTVPFAPIMIWHWPRVPVTETRGPSGLSGSGTIRGNVGEDEQTAYHK
ncbi:hypothetical protein BDN71DRAFT_1436725 [Pleurotus eryngii]|uniref:Uncharacterized protein n=1 Tax=Pleurotus eryngii TaxID=5323 RepID=A0A9P5ZHP9_PLEER|nr:hypothetical protein BDN71DRAFT_1436725 [Pleurotus eryngii]